MPRNRSNRLPYRLAVRSRDRWPSCQERKAGDCLIAEAIELFRGQLEVKPDSGGASRAPSSRTAVPSGRSSAWPGLLDE